MDAPRTRDVQPKTRPKEDIQDPKKGATHLSPSFVPGTEKNRSNHQVEDKGASPILHNVVQHTQKTMESRVGEAAHRTTQIPPISGAKPKERYPRQDEEDTPEQQADKMADSVRQGYTKALKNEFRKRPKTKKILKESALTSSEQENKKRTDGAEGQSTHTKSDKEAHGTEAPSGGFPAHTGGESKRDGPQEGTRYATSSTPTLQPYSVAATDPEGSGSPSLFNKFKSHSPIPPKTKTAGVKPRTNQMKTKPPAKVKKMIAEQPKQVAKKALKAGQRTSFRLVTALLKGTFVAVKNLFATAIGTGTFILFPVFILAMVGMLVASPFGILFSSHDNTEGTFSLPEIVTQGEAEQEDRITAIELEFEWVNEVRITYDGSESNTAIHNWWDVVAVFAVKTALADGALATDVVSLDTNKQQKLLAIYHDMTMIDTWVEEEIRYITEYDENGEPYRDSYPYYILHILVNSLTAHEGADLYGFNTDERAILDELMHSDYQLDFLLLIGYGIGGLSQEELDAIRQQLAGLDVERQAFVETALTLVGRVSYFWGGKSVALGWDDRWGQSTLVSAPGSRWTGTYQPYGLDCSGYIAWVYAQFGLDPAELGWGVNRQWETSSPIEWHSAQPGDLAIFAVPGTIKTNHIGIIVGFTAEGIPLVAHCNASKNNITIDEAYATGFQFVRRPILFYN